MTAVTRIAIEQTLDGLRISIPSRKRILEILLEGVVVLPFVGAEILILLDAIGSGDGSRYSWVGIALWTVGGAFVFRRFAWVVFGKEVIVAGSSELSISRQVLGVTRGTRKYAAARIRRLHVLPYALRSQDPEIFWVFLEYTARSGRIAFDYGRARVTFGAALDDEEASKLFDRLKPVYPD